MDIDEDGCPYRWLPDGRRLSIQPLTFGRARIVIGSGRLAHLFYDDGY